jgi:hypothetical protein
MPFIAAKFRAGYELTGIDIKVTSDAVRSPPGATDAYIEFFTATIRQSLKGFDRTYALAVYRVIFVPCSPSPLQRRLLEPLFSSTSDSVSYNGVNVINNG